MNEGNPVTQMALHFALISLFAVGGANAVLPEIHRFVVDTHGWMSSEDFTNFFALAQAAPGPNLIVVTLIGWYVAGLTGAVAATAGMCAPPFFLAYIMARVAQAYGSLSWFAILKSGLAPVTVGLMIASGCLLTNAAAVSWRSYLITAATAAFVATTRYSPLWALAVAGIVGILGLV